MVSFTYIIKDKFGIHARPGLLLVQEAGKLTSNITILKEQTVVMRSGCSVL